MASDDLRARMAAVLAAHEPVPGMWDCTCGVRTYDFEEHRADVVLAVVQPELDREQELSQRLMEQRQQMAAERYVWQERGDRYRGAWQSARQRAQAYGEGIVRLCDDRDAYKGWMEEQAERANRAEQELAAVRAALEALTAQSATALSKRDKARERARIAEAELETLRAGLREIGGDPTQVQNLYAQLASRTRQWKAAEAALQAVREAQSLGDALAAVAKHDGLTTEPTASGGLRGLLEHVGIDVAGRVITVDGVPIDDVGGGDEVVRCSGLHCLNTEFHGRLDERGWLSGAMGTWLCPDCKTTTKE